MKFCLPSVLFFFLIFFLLKDNCFTELCYFLSNLNMNQPCCCCCVASVVSDSVRPHRRQPTRLPCPWDSPGKNTGVGCHFLLQCTKVKSESEVTQSCPTLVTPWTAAHQAPPSMGFSRQKYWSGVPLPSPYTYRISHRCTYIPSLLNLPPISCTIPPLYVDTEPLFEFAEPYSEFPLAIYFTFGNVSFHVTLSIHLTLPSPPA